MLLDGKHILVTGGTGSLGRTLVRRLLGGSVGRPNSITIFSRDEAKQHDMRLDFLNARDVTDEILYKPAELRFELGDVSNFDRVVPILARADIVFHAAAMKQIPACEYAPFEAVRTNILGAENIVRAIRDHRLDIECVVGITTDKACKPVNVMGMTKALQERIFARANLDALNTRFVTARYGNVLASRGSVLPLFHRQIRDGGPVTVTSTAMTRFLMSLEDAVDTVLAACEHARPGEIFVPTPPSARIIDLAQALVEDRTVDIAVVGTRPGEKVHEILVSEEETARSSRRDDHIVVAPILPELQSGEPGQVFGEDEYSSADVTLNVANIADLLARNRLRVADEPVWSS